MDEWNKFISTGRVEDYINYVKANERKKEQVKRENGNKNGRDCDTGDIHG